MKNFFKDNGIVLSFSFLILGVALIGSPYNQSHSFLLKTVFFQTLILGLSLIFVLNQFLYRRSSIRFPLIYPILLYCGYSILSLIFSQYKYASSMAFLKLVFFVLLYLLIVNAVPDFRKLSFLIKTVILSTGLVSLIGILQTAGVSFAAWIPPYPGRISSTFGNPNFLGGFLAITLPLAAWVFLLSSDKKKIFYLLVSLAGLSALFLTRSRGAIVASLLSFLFIGAVSFLFKLWRFSGRRKILFWGFLIIAVTVIFFLIDTGPDSLAKRFSQTSPGEGSLFIRLKIWESAWNLIKSDLWFGVGLGNFQIFFPAYSVPDFYKLVPMGNVLHAENEYLEIWSELGIIGLALFVWIMGGVYYKAFKFIRQEQDPGKKVLALGLLGGLSAGLIQGLVCVSLRWTGPDFFFWLYLSLLMALALKDKTPRMEKTSAASSSGKFPQGLKVLIYSLILFITTLFGIWQIRGYSANVYLARAQFYMDSQNKIAAVSELEKAYKRNPHCLEAMFLLGALSSELKRYPESEYWFDKLQKFAPDYGNVHEWKGLLFHKTGRRELAEEEYKKAVKMNGSGMNHNLLGELFAEQGESALAEKEFLKGIEADSSMVLNRISLAQLYLVQGEYERAVEQAKLLLDIPGISKDEKVSLSLLLAGAYFKLESLDELSEEIESTIALNPDSVQKDKMADLLQGFAWEKVKKNEDLDWALRFCDEALFLNPSDPGVIFDTRGWVYFRKGDYARAEVYIRKAAEHDPQNEKYKKDLEIISNVRKGKGQKIEIK